MYRKGRLGFCIHPLNSRSEKYRDTLNSFLKISIYDIYAAIIKHEKSGALKTRGWSGGAMVLGKLPVPGRPTDLDYIRARAYCTCSRCGWGLFGLFYSHLSFLSSISLSLGDGPI